MYSNNLYHVYLRCIFNYLFELHVSSTICQSVMYMYETLADDLNQLLEIEYKLWTNCVHKR